VNNDIKIEEHLDRGDQSMISISKRDNSEEFNIEFDARNVEEVEISFEWDHGYGGGAPSYFYVPIKLLEDAIKKIKAVEKLK